MRIRYDTRDETDDENYNSDESDTYYDAEDTFIPESQEPETIPDNDDYSNSENSLTPEEDEDFVQKPIPVLTSELKQKTFVQKPNVVPDVRPKVVSVKPKVASAKAPYNLRPSTSKDPKSIELQNKPKVPSIAPLSLADSLKHTFGSKKTKRKIEKQILERAEIRRSQRSTKGVPPDRFVP